MEPPFKPYIFDALQDHGVRKKTFETASKDGSIKEVVPQYSGPDTVAANVHAEVFDLLTKRGLLNHVIQRTPQDYSGLLYAKFFDATPQEEKLTDMDELRVAFENLKRETGFDIMEWQKVSNFLNTAESEDNNLTLYPLTYGGVRITRKFSEDGFAKEQTLEINPKIYHQDSKPIFQVILGPISTLQRVYLPGGGNL